MSRISASPLITLTTSSSNLDRLREQAEAAQTTAMTGLSVARPSDAPGQWTLIHGLTSAVADQERFGQTAGMAVPLLQTAESALGEAFDIVSRAKELAVQASSDTLPTDQRDALSAEVDALLGQLINIANSDHAGRHIFAGSAYDELAFDETGAYMGSEDIPSAQAGQNLWIETGFNGDTFFSNAIAELSGLSAAVMDPTDPSAATAAYLDTLDDALHDITSARTTVGLTMQRAEDALSASESLQLSLAQQLDQTVGADPVDAYTRLAETQAAYEAALQVTSSTMGMNLFSFMR